MCYISNGMIYIIYQRHTSSIRLIVSLSIVSQYLIFNLNIYFVIHLTVNYRGSTGFGEKSLKSLLGKVGSQDVSDVQVTPSFYSSFHISGSAVRYFSIDSNDFASCL